jgi:hypothetical protein
VDELDAGSAIDREDAERDLRKMESVMTAAIGPSRKPRPTTATAASGGIIASPSSRITGELYIRHRAKVDRQTDAAASALSVRGNQT